MSGPTFRFSCEADVWLIITALRTTARKFEDDAETLRAYQSIARQLRDQAANATRIANSLEAKL